MNVRLRRLVPGALYVVVLVASFYPQSIRPHDTVPHIGDSLENAYIVAWNTRQLFRDPVHVFDANILYPATKTLTTTDHRLLPSVLVAPVLWTTDNPVLAYNVGLALGFLLAAYAGRRLGLALGLDPVAAWGAGALYAFHTYNVSEASRLQLMFHGFLPLALEQVLVLLRTGRRSAAWKAAGWMLLLGLCANYLLLYGLLTVGLVLAAAMAARPRLVIPRLPPLLVAGVVAGVLFLPVAIPYASSSREKGFTRDLPTGITFEHYFQTSRTNLMYGPQVPDAYPRHRPHFIGFFSLALVALALGATRKADGEPGALLPPHVWVPAAALLALVFIFLTLGKDMKLLGHDLGPGPYRLLHAFVPGFKLVRFPERLAFVGMLFVALLAGRGLAILRERRMPSLALLLAAVIPLEHVSPISPAPRVPVWDRVPQVYRWLAADSARAVVELPMHGMLMDRLETLEMYFSAYHFKPIVHGRTSFLPPESQKLREWCHAFPSPDSIDGFRQMGVDTVVIHNPPDGVLEQYKQLRIRRREAYARHHGLQDLEFYRGVKRLEATGVLQRVADFEGPTARIPGGRDVVYRLSRGGSPGE